MALVKTGGILPTSSGLSNLVSTKFAIGKDVESSFWTDKATFWLLVLCMIFLALQLGIIFFYFRNLPPEIPIFYSKEWGEPMLGKNIFIFLLPALSFFFIVLNLIISAIFLKENKQSFSSNKQSFSSNKQSFSSNKQSLTADRFLARLLVISNLVISFATFYGVVKIVTLLA